MKKAYVQGTIRVGGDVGEDGPKGKVYPTLLTWNHVYVEATDLGKFLGVDGLVGAVKSITTRIEAGDIGYLEVECYGARNDVMKRVKGKPAAAAAIQEQPPCQVGPPTYTVRFPLLSLSAMACGPFKKDRAARIHIQGKTKRR